MVRLPDLGIDNSDYSEYTPIGYSEFFSVLRQVPLSAENTSFLDYGSGKGRVLVAAATLPFKNVFGVEISEDLCRIAKANIKRMRHRRAGIISIIQSDAMGFVVPEDVNIIFFFNPFRGATLEKVIENIFDSYYAQPRTIYIIFFNKKHFDQCIIEAGCNLIRPIDSMYFYPNYSCGIYEISSQQSHLGTPSK